MWISSKGKDSICTITKTKYKDSRYKSLVEREKKAISHYCLPVMQLILEWVKRGSPVGLSLPHVVTWLSEVQDYLVSLSSLLENLSWNSFT